MRCLLSAIVVCCSFSSLVADNLNVLSQAEKKQGFELLFKGDSLNGWKHAGNWRVVDHAISRAGKGGSLVYTSKKNA